MEIAIGKSPAKRWPQQPHQTEQEHRQPTLWGAAQRVHVKAAFFL